MDASAVGRNTTPIAQLIRERQGVDAKPTEDEQQSGERVLEMAKANGNALSVAWTANSKTVNLETPPFKYLHQSRGDEPLAAKNLSNYWELRKKRFGENQFCRPLGANSDKSALNHQDIKVFESGFLLMLPPDTKGWPVVCYDRSKLENDFSVEDLDKLIPNARRCLCYVLSIAAEDPVSQEDGITFLEIYHSSMTNQPFDIAFHDALKEWLEVIPIRSARLEVVVRPPRREGAVFVGKTIPTLQENITERHKGKIHFTVQSFTEKLLTEVENRGFKTEGIPSAIGGTWVWYNGFLDWRRERGVIEGLVDAYHTEDKKKADAMVANVFRKEARRKRKREHDNEYARQKRELGREEVFQLESQIKLLQTQGTQLTAENQRLTNLLSVARERVQGIDQLQESCAGLPPSLLQAHLPGAMTGLAPSIQPAWQPFLATSMLPAEVGRGTVEPCLDPRFSMLNVAAPAAAPLSLQDALSIIQSNQTASAQGQHNPFAITDSNSRPSLATDLGSSELLSLQLALAQRRDEERRLQAAIAAQQQHRQLSGATEATTPSLEQQVLLRELRLLLQRNQDALSRWPQPPPPPS